MQKIIINKEKVQLMNELTKLIVNEESAKEFYNNNKDKFGIISPFEVFSIKFFQDDNLEIEEIKQIAGKMINLFRTGLEGFVWERDIPLIKKLLMEGEAIKSKFNEFKGLIKNKDFKTLEKEIDILDELNKRFHKMQNVIFSNLESSLINPKPLKVMWSLHDDVALLHKQLLKSIKEESKDLNILIGKFFFLVLGIIEKEELLILPSLSFVLKEEKLTQLENELDFYGYSFISDAKTIDIKYETNNYDNHLFTSNNGKLNLDELIAILGCAGDITFVDKNNKVKFFNTPHNHFKRSPSIIGRDVVDCHPSKSIHIVNEIIEKFKSKEEDRVDFWINFKGSLILISYFAIRNPEDEYLGVLELTQDITNFKNISGEKRILDFTNSSSK